MTPALLTHVAVLVPSVEKAARKLENLGVETQPIDEFPSDGTRECYIGSPRQSARLLLLEALSQGPYRRALQKRGPGLHHLGVQVANLEAYAEQLGQAGWLLHTRSLRSIRETQTAFFARPGTPFLLEAWEKAGKPSPASIEELRFPTLDLKFKNRVDSLGITNTRVTWAPSSDPAAISLKIIGPELSCELEIHELTQA
jgi:methylmalonyl-CoA/ethylmalonyl-CoA epimerase